MAANDDDGVIVPLAFDEDGNPIPIPPEARFFRLKVRRGNARRPRLLCGKTGQPVLLPVDTQPEDFQERVGPGIYRLEPVDADGYGLQDAPTFKYTIEQEDEDDDPNASRAEAFVAKILKENRTLVTRVLDHIEQQSQEEATRRAAQAEEQAKRSAEFARLLATQAERFERATTALAEQNAKGATAMLEQNTKLVTTMANKFGDYIAEATNLLAAHPAAGNTPSAADIVGEHKQIRNAVADLAEATLDDDNPLLSLLDKSLDSALPVLAPALQRVIHRAFGLDQQQSDALTGVPTQPVLAEGSPPTSQSNGQPSQTELARVMEVLNHLTVPERAAAMAAQQAMDATERDRLRAELVALPTSDAVNRVRQILAERERGGRNGSDAQAHLRAVLALLAEDEQETTQELLDALSAGQRARWRSQILSRPPRDAAALIRSQLAELAAAMPDVDPQTQPSDDLEQEDTKTQS